MARTVEHIRGGRPGLPIYLSALRGSGKKAESCEKTPAGEPFRYAVLLPYSIVGRSTSPASLCGNSSAEGKGLRTESGSVARPAIARTGRMNSECGPSIHRKSVIYLCSTPQVQIRDVPRRHVFPAAWPGREMIFRPSALSEDSLTGVLYETFRMNSVGMSGEKPFLIGAGRIPGPAAGRLFGFSIIGSPDGASRHTNRFRRTGSLAKDAVHLAAEIGRASCRERV